MFLFSFDYDEEEEDDNLDLGEKIGVILMCFVSSARGGLKLKKAWWCVIFIGQKKNARRDTTTTRKNIQYLYLASSIHFLRACARPRCADALWARAQKVTRL